MLFQWLRRIIGAFKHPPITLSEEAWRALLQYDPPKWIPVGGKFIPIEEARKRVDQNEYSARLCRRIDEELRKEWEEWQLAHADPRERKKLIMIK